MAEVNSVPYASAAYRVTSAATMSVEATTMTSGRLLKISGRNFLPHLTLVLISYGMSGSQKPLLLGTATADGRGRFSFRRTTTTTRLPPGQYVVRAAATNSYAAQVADAFFQIVM